MNFNPNLFYNAPFLGVNFLFSSYFPFISILQKAYSETFSVFIFSTFVLHIPFFLREAVGGKPVKPVVVKPLPQKSDFRSSFCGFAASRLPAADLQPNADPERSEGTRPN